MGRPLNSRFFDPVPSSNGESVVSYTFSDRGSYTALPTVTVSAPDLPGGVTATGNLSMRVLSTVVTVRGTGATNADYNVGDQLTLDGGTAVTPATWTVSGVRGRTIAVATAGTNNTFAVNDTVTFSTGWNTPAVAVVTATDDSSGGGLGLITSLTFLDPAANKGVRTNAIPSDPITPDSTSNVGGLQGLEVNIGFEIDTITNTNPGNYSALPANPAGTSTNSITGGTGAELTVTWEVRDFAVTSGGSGYTSAADAALTFAPASSTAATATLTATGTNVILANAYVVGGTQALAADIVKQTSTSDYVMATTEGQSICGLVPSDTPAEGQAYILVTDSGGGSYWALKITAHKVVLRRRGAGPWIYPNGYSAPWTLGSALAEVVSIASA